VRTEIWTRGGVAREIYLYSVGAEVVWGATGRVITQFLEVVFNVQIAGAAGRRAARRAR
jgi:hypothetical protein